MSDNITVSAPNALAFAVKAIYGDVHGMLPEGTEKVRLIHARTEETTQIPQLADAVRLLDQYNDFNGDTVANTLMQMHNEGLLHTASFGREYYPMLYLRIPMYTGQRSKHKAGIESRIYSKDERSEIRGKVMEIIERKLDAGEVSEEAMDTIRVGWP